MQRPILNTAAIASGTAYAIPAAAGVPATAYIIGVRSLVVLPLASAGVASTTSPIQEVQTSSDTPAAGEIYFDIATQQFTSGDDIPENSVSLLDFIIAGEQTHNA